MKSEQNGEADELQESFGELVIASGDAPIALDSFEEVFYPMTTSVERCGEWHSRINETVSKITRMRALGPSTGVDLKQGFHVSESKRNRKSRSLLSPKILTSSERTYCRCDALSYPRLGIRQSVQDLVSFFPSFVPAGQMLFSPFPHVAKQS